MNATIATEVVETRLGRLCLLTSDVEAAEWKKRKDDDFVYYHREIECLRGWLKESYDPVFLDIGANVGIVTMSVLDLCSSVHLWEAQPVLCDLLSSTISLNSWDRVHLHRAALGAVNGEIPMPDLDYSIPSHFAGVELRRLPNPEVIQDNVSRTVNIPLRTVDSYKLPQVDVMKIDVEGMDAEVLSGAEETIRTFHPKILIEYVKCGLDPIRHWMNSFGYRWWEVDGNLACEAKR